MYLLVHLARQMPRESREYRRYGENKSGPKFGNIYTWKRIGAQGPTAPRCTAFSNRCVIVVIAFEFEHGPLGCLHALSPRHAIKPPRSLTGSLSPWPYPSSKPTSQFSGLENGPLFRHIRTQETTASPSRIKFVKS